jgi:hypothetical protein
MNRLRTILASSALIALLCISQLAAGASHADRIEDGSQKYSLRNLKNYKRTSLSSLNGTYKLRGFETLPYSSQTRYNALLRYDNGSSTYVFPYKVVSKAPKFKTPARD